MSNVFWRCILEGAPEMQPKKPKKNVKKRKKTRQTCKHFHGYSTQFAQRRAWLLGNIQNGLYLHSKGGEVVAKGFYMPHMKSICKCCARLLYFPLEVLTFCLSLSLSLSGCDDDARIVCL